VTLAQRHEWRGHAKTGHAGVKTYLRGNETRQLGAQPWVHVLPVSVGSRGTSARACSWGKASTVFNARPIARLRVSALSSDRVAAHVRNRQQLRRQARALSAEGRISGVILTILPPAMVAILSVVSPGYLGQLTGTGAGRLMALTAVGLLVVGGLWLRRLAQVEV
jgi:hypothetical protein